MSVFSTIHALCVIVLTVIGGVAGGIVSSVAGGASIVTYPLLLTCGVPPLGANVTNDVALVWNYGSAIASSKRELSGSWKRIQPMLVFSTLGTVGGAVALLWLPAASFSRAVPWFLLLSALAFLLEGRLSHHHGASPGGKQASLKGGSRWRQITLLMGMGLCGVYTGYFGAASGIIVLALLGWLYPQGVGRTGRNVREGFLINNAVKNLCCGVASIISALIFILRTKIWWLEAIPLGVGMLLGGIAGPRLLRRIPVRFVRWGIAALAAAQAAWFFTRG